MTKIFLALTSVLLCAQAVAVAQTAGKPAPSKSSNPATAGKTTANASRLVGVATRNFENGAFAPSDSGSLHYSAPNLGYDDKVGEWKFDLSTYWEHNGSTYEEIYHSMQTLDAAGRITQTEGETFAAGNWWASEYAIYTYDAKGNIDSQMSAYYNGTGWDSTAYKNTYDAAGQLTVQTSHVWNKALNKWHNGFRQTRTYNTAGELVAVASEQWDLNSLQWVNSYRYTNTYVNGRRTEAVSEIYTGNNWGYSSKTTFAYDAAGNMKEEENFSWSNNTWEPQQRNRYTYSGNKEPLTIERAYWVNGAYKNMNKLTSVYNSRSQAISELTETWDDAAGKYTLQDGDSETRYYYEDYTNSVKDARGAQGSISLYPVPASTMLQLRVNTATAATLMLAAADGRVVKQLQLPAGNAQTAIDVSNLPAGTYILSMATGGEVITRKVVVK